MPLDNFAHLGLIGGMRFYSSFSLAGAFMLLVFVLCYGWLAGAWR